jgi:hypothetical protein
MSDKSEESMLEKLSEIAGVSKTGGGLVPMPNARGEMNDHLFVNLTLGNVDHRENAHVLSSQLRNVAFSVFEQLGYEPSILRYTTIVVSLFTKISTTEGFRIYRTRLNTRDLSRLEKDTFIALLTGEESHRPDLHEFLQASR